MAEALSPKHEIETTNADPDALRPRTFWREGRRVPGTMQAKRAPWHWTRVPCCVPPGRAMGYPVCNDVVHAPGGCRTLVGPTTSTNAPSWRRGQHGAPQGA